MKVEVKQIEYVQQYYLQKTDSEISSALGVTEKTVAKLRKDLGLQRSAWTEKKLGMTPEQAAEADRQLKVLEDHKKNEKKYGLDTVKKPRKKKKRK